MDIVKDLKEVRKTAKKIDKADESTKLVDDVKLLLESNSSKELSLLKTLRLDTHIIKAQNKIGKNIELERFENEYGDIFTKSDIKEIALDYNLRFLPIEYYKGNICSELPSVILRFCEKNKISTTDNYLHSSFHIMAPKENFKLLEKPKDPLLFYKVGVIDGEDIYTLVYKWGDDFTPLRLINGFINRSKVSILLSIPILLTMTILIISSFLGIYEFSDYVSVGIIPFIIGTFLGWMLSDDSSEDTWNSEFGDNV